MSLSLNTREKKYIGVHQSSYTTLCIVNELNKMDTFNLTWLIVYIKRKQIQPKIVDICENATG